MDLAQAVENRLGLSELPDAPPAARPTRQNLTASPALSILSNGPKDFSGRVVGVMVSDGADAGLPAALGDAILDAEAQMILIAPRVRGITDSGGNLHPAHEKIGGGPSVLYDAVAILLGQNHAAGIANTPAAQDFLRAAHAHCKFIALHGADALIDACGSWCLAG